MINHEMFEERIRPERGMYSDTVDLFLESENKTLRFNCSNVDEAKRVAWSCSARNKKYNQNLTVWRKNTQVYLIKG